MEHHSLEDLGEQQLAVRVPLLTLAVLGVTAVLLDFQLEVDCGLRKLPQGK